MPIFESKEGVWYPKDKAAKDMLEERKVKTIGVKSRTSYERGYGNKPEKK